MSSAEWNPVLLRKEQRMGTSEKRQWAGFVVCTISLFICSAIPCTAQMAYQHAITAQADLFKDETISKQATACVAITLGPKSVYVPNFVLDARFSTPVSGYFEIDGSRVSSWKGEQRVEWTQQYVKQRVYRITIGVNSPVHVNKVWINSSEPVTEIKEVACQDRKQ